MRDAFSSTVSVPADLAALVGTEVGITPAVTITQEQINGFADVTGDHQWIHVDTERAAAGPFGTTIAHGFLTLSLVPLMMEQVLQVQHSSMGINYGLDRVRFLKPVPAGATLQATVTLVSADPVGQGEGSEAIGVQAKASVLIEITDTQTPCVIAEVLFRYYN